MLAVKLDQSSQDLTQIRFSDLVVNRKVIKS